MNFFDVDISPSVAVFLKSKINAWQSTAKANETLRNICGIEDFFACDSEIQRFSEVIHAEESVIACENRAEYGDFQTNQTLAYKIAEKIKTEGASPKIVIEPTCGKGHFILAVLNTFDNIEKIYGIEIQEKYIWQAKINILDFFLNNPQKDTPEIHILHSNIFDFDYRSINKVIGKKELLIIGNPPWVTNSALSIMHSKNLPQKSNFKQQKGLDAMTGKGNFDIAEFITMDLLKNFGKCDGHMAFLVKNTVVKNIVYELPKLKLPLAEIEKQNIDSKKEFNVSVDASLFCCKLNKNTEYVCQESDFYTSKVKCIFGWRNNKFMSNLSSLNNDIDGLSPVEWRQGIKHDCSKVMELEYDGEFFRNKLGEKFTLERDLVYPLLKSSDLKGTYADPSRKLVIVTQKFVGQDTAYIQKYPQTFEYLHSHISFFRSRKSSIYKGKYNFSIFGVGNYSFKPYKIAISGLYKTFHFCLVKPQDNKPVMLDDTCYFIGFDSLEQAEYIWRLLNTEIVSNFLKNISFKDAKRMITKEVLMRIDLKKVAVLLGERTNLFDELSVNHDSQLKLFDNTEIIDKY